MTTQHDHARKLLDAIRDKIGSPVLPIHGYAAAAELIGLNGSNYGRAMGQVCSRIDAASFVAGLPMLSLGMVRTTDGSINADSFTGEWEKWNQEIKTSAANHIWTLEQIDAVMAALDGLPTDGASALWLNYLKRETQSPGFIRFNLHRKAKAV